jgi:hypothetical protein
MHHLHRPILCALALLVTSACGQPGRNRVPSGDAGFIVTDPSCPAAENVLPDLTCGTEAPDRVCSGSCAQTLDGVVGVGLSTCRCIDSGSGFGGQWVCDTAACDDATPGDAGTDTRTPTDAGVTTDSAAVCPPAAFEPPSEPGCTTAQLYEVMSIETQADYDAFVADPDNTACNTCMSQSVLACGTSLGCDRVAGDLLCCFEDRCGDDDACRSAAIDGECGAEAQAVTRCVGSITACSLNPLAPPSECFP